MKILKEVTRWEILRRSQRESPLRFDKKKFYTAKDFDNVDFKELFENNNFTWASRVGDYIVTISFEGAFDILQWELKPLKGKNRWKRITHKILTDALSKAMDKEDLYIDCSCPDFCLSADTQIKLLNGEVVSVAELLNRFKNNEELWVYSTDSKGDFKPGHVTDVWISGYVQDMIEVTLDNGKKILTTPNHRYMLRNGEYCDAQNLTVGQSLMPLYFSYHNGYESVKLNSQPKSFVNVYKQVASELLQNEIEDAKIRSINGKKRAQQKLIDNGMKVINQLLNENLPISEENYNQYREKGFPYYQTIVELGLLEQYNHKVINIKTIHYNEPIPVYDLTVDKYNNFFVDAGVVLHNCYRFSYWATRADCKFGLPQNKAPTVRNVKNNKGYCCKHILAVLYGKRWVPAAAKCWLQFIQANPELSEWYIWGEPRKRNNNKKLSVDDEIDEEE